MFAWLSSLLLLAAPVQATAPPRAAPLPARTFVDWPARPGTRTTASGLVLTNITAPCKPGDGDGGGDPGQCRIAGVRIERPGSAPVELHGLAGGIAKLAVGPMTAGAPASVILSTFTGGAHCCEQYALAVPAGTGWHTGVISWTRPDWEGGAIETQTQFDGGLAGFPGDVDGDGVPDIVLSDDRFDYTFSSYAGSASPPVVLNWIGGRWVDVSASPRFARLFEADLAKRRAGCVATDDGEHNGVCAAYAADAARLGRFAEAWPVVLAHQGRSPDEAQWGLKRCPVAFAGDHCPPGKQIVYPDYPAALRAFLAVTGYLHDPAP